MDIKTLLDQAIAAARAGRKVEARRLVEKVLDADERNERAWLWLSGLVESDEERVICLENVLTINPRNETARKGLAALQGGPVPGQPAASFSPEKTGGSQPVVKGLQPLTPWPASPLADEPSDHSPAPDRRAFIAITLALVLILICTVVSIIAFVVLSPPT